MGVLTGYKVVEFSRYPAGSILGMLLADQGADVHKIEPLGGDPSRGTEEFSVWNRGKHSSSSKYSKNVIAHYANSADIVIECLNPSEKNSLGVTFDSLSLVSSDREPVVVSIPAFPEGHPLEWLPARESLLSASSGVYALNPSGDNPVPGEGPSFHELYYASTFAAITAAPAVIAGLLYREKTGKGQQITVPIHDSMYQGMGTALVRHSQRPHGRQEGHPVIARFYRCGDGRWINVNISIPRFLKPFLQAIGHIDWLDHLTDNERLNSDGTFLEEWTQKFEELWSNKTALEWEDFMEQVGVPGTACRTIDEWLDEPQASESGAVIHINDPTFGRMKQPGLLVKTHGHLGQIKTPAPELPRDN